MRTDRVVLGMVAMLAFTVGLCQVPPSVSYQGKLLDASGSPVVDGAYAMEFRFYDACTGGALLLTDSHPGVQTKDGIYSVSGGLIARDKTGLSGTHVGRSLETYAWYELNGRISFGAGIAHIFPGTFLRTATQGAAYTYPYVVLNFMDRKRLLEVP